MSDRVLPTLLVHGDLVWIGCLAAFVALVFFVVARVRRSRARRWARNLPAALDLHSDRVVRGTLGGGDRSITLRAATTTATSATPSYGSSRPTAAIPLVGSSASLAGTQRADARATATAVAAGDEVIAHGTLERRARRRRLPQRCDHVRARRRADHAVRADARRGRTAPRGSRSSLIARDQPLARLHRASARSAPVGAARAPSGHADACVLAATMPGGDSAGRLLLAVLDFAHHNNRAEVDHRVAVAELVGDCDYAMRPLEQARLWDELLAMAHALQLARRTAARARRARPIRLDAVTFAPTAPKLPRLQLLIMAHEWIAAGDELERTEATSTRPHAARRRAVSRGPLARLGRRGQRTACARATSVMTSPKRRCPTTGGASSRLATLEWPIDTWYEVGNPIR